MATDNTYIITIADYINSAILLATTIGVLASIYFSRKSLQELFKQREYEYENTALQSLARDTSSLRERLHLITASINQLHYLIDKLRDKEEILKLSSNIGDDIDKLSAKLWSTDSTLFSDSEKISNTLTSYRRSFSDFIGITQDFLDYRFRFIASIGDEVIEENKKVITVNDIDVKYKQYIESEKELHKLLIDNYLNQKANLKNKYLK